jgi:hypothetical protein
LFQHNDALKHIQTAKARDKNNLLYSYLESNIYFIKAFLNETSADKNNYIQKFDQWEKSLKTSNKKSPFHRYCLGNLYLQRALIQFKHGSYVKAGIDFRRANGLLEENKKLFPNFIAQNKELGLIHAFVGTIPQQYSWLVNFIGFSGSISQGEAELMKVFNESIKNTELNYLQVESFMGLSILTSMLNYEQDSYSKLLSLAEKVSPIYQTSPIYIYYKVVLLKNSGHNNLAINELKKYNNTNSQMRFDYLDYIHGLLLLQKNDNNAVNFLFRYVSNFKGIHNIKTAYQKIAWYYLINGDTAKYEYYVNIIKQVGNSISDADKLAQKEAESNIIPHPQLLQAQLLSDGGYYEEALNILNNIDSTKICKKTLLCVEYKYRKARVLHLQNKEYQAIQYYNETIIQGKDLKEYFAANSALMLGNIYELKQQKAEAKKYYNMCLSLPFEEYRASIQQKAKAGLQRIQ